MKRFYFCFLFIYFVNTLSGQQINCPSVINTSCVSNPQKKLYGYNEIKTLVANYKEVSEDFYINNTYAYYIDSRAILFMDLALKRLVQGGNPLYNGVNMNFVTFKYKQFEDKWNFQTRISFAAGNKELVGGATKFKIYYDVFSDFYKTGLTASEKNTFIYNEIDKGVACPGNCDGVISQWYSLGGSNHLSQLPYQFNSADNVLFSTKQALKKRKKRHAAQHGDEFCAGCQTKSMFVSSGNIHNLATFLKSLDPANDKFPVIAVYFISYKVKDPEVNPKHKFQTSAILIPMRKVNDEFLPDPCMYNCFIENAKGLIEIYNINHGELCPDGCPEEGN